ncbi:hypothetical protein CTEN210_07786 [Chaetoceros tenuissimus]|uniref:Uncharacterized protein n=1 Tax=Chaetoceros tenuissimus TaxID=426638 RepID=A0AAD3CUJ1_9STRA|nr:hypothetical protein CTEN210_07786 [Chaetoceros tenuissimus]
MTSSDPILSNLQKVEPSIQNYKTLKHIIQGSAEGFIVDAMAKDSDEIKPYFVKYVDPKKYASKSWPDLRRTIHYTRTEVRFYNEILPLMRKNLPDGSDWEICPKVYLAEYDVSGLMEEEESTEAMSTTADPQYDENNTSALDGKYGVLVMDNAIIANKCFQKAPLRLQFGYKSVEALAKFHAAAFQREEILSMIANRLCRYGGSYHLKNRNPKELQHLVQAWEDFKTCVTPVLKNGELDDEKIQNLGQRLFDAAEYVANELSPSPGDPYATVVHGDYKAMNIMFRGNEDDFDGSKSLDEIPTPLLIDFASTGVGLGMSDLAMHIAQIALPEDLENNDLEEKLVSHYYTCFENALPEDMKSIYSKDEALRHHRLATIDYFRFILGRQWKGVTQEIFAKRNKDTNFAMVNRNIEAAVKFAERTSAYLTEIEAEMKVKCS